MDEELVETNEKFSFSLLVDGTVLAMKRVKLLSMNLFFFENYIFIQNSPTFCHYCLLNKMNSGKNLFISLAVFLIKDQALFLLLNMVKLTKTLH